MRACPACGASNDPTDDFCGNCGAYLGWSDRPAAQPTVLAPGEPSSPDPEEPPAAEPSRGGSAPRPSPAGAPTAPEAAPPPATVDRTAPLAAGDRSPASAGADGATPSEPDPPAAPPASAPPTAGASRTRRRGHCTAGAGDRPTPAAADQAAAARPAPPPVTPTPTAPASPQPVATSGPVPAPDPAPAPVQPVLPAKPVAPRPVVRPVAAADDDVTGAPCPSCGVPNPPGRRFCRRCAAPLDPAAPPEALPWWRAVWPFRRGVRSGSGRAVRLLVVLAVVLALCAGGLLLLPAGRALFEDARDKLGKARQVTPERTTASAESPGHPATNTTDGVSNSYWAAPAAGATVTYTFGTPFRLVDVIVTNGSSPDPQEYAGQARALRMDLVVTTRDGEQHRSELTLADKPGPQTFPTGLSDVHTVSLTLRSPAGRAPGRRLALAEVEFFQRA
ncbi:NADase-type glycan-binding domain-containing protein [Streptomyces sp. NPDC014006]|uniref:NADase-type glycan-binding domain-containing protein n=1 Tax=Streptomyces sp. NPDC014006 TaxID=3364870 RepID=UPI003701B289